MSSSASKSRKTHRKTLKKSKSFELSQEDIEWLNMPGTSVEDYPAYLKQFGHLVEGTPQECAKQITQLAGDRRVTVLLIDDAIFQKDHTAREADIEFDWAGWTDSPSTEIVRPKRPQVRKKRK